jgi:hypothetical protein
MKFKKGHKSWNTGLHNDPRMLPTIKRVIEVNTGNSYRKGKTHSEETKRKISKSKIGTIISEETRWKLHNIFKGSGSLTWKGGITPVNYLIRHSLEYKLWREAVYKRDNYTCIWCGQVGGKLNADHIKPFSLYPALRFAIDNGRTLCLSCHKKTDTYGFANYNKKI